MGFFTQPICNNKWQVSPLSPLGNTGLIPCEPLNILKIEPKKIGF
jgi:hypothetical protein